MHGTHTPSSRYNCLQRWLDSGTKPWQQEPLSLQPCSSLVPVPTSWSRLYGQVLMSYDWQDSSHTLGAGGEVGIGSSTVPELCDSQKACPHQTAGRQMQGDEPPPFTPPLNLGES